MIRESRGPEIEPHRGLAAHDLGEGDFQLGHRTGVRDTLQLQRRLRRIPWVSDRVRRGWDEMWSLGFELV